MKQHTCHRAHLMLLRLSKIPIVTSSVSLCISLLLFVGGYVLDPAEYYLSFDEDCHVGVFAHGLDTRIVVFSDAEYGPYCGSITQLADADGIAYPPVRYHLRFGEYWGIYYRNIRWPDSTGLWTLMVSLWYPIIVFAIILAYSCLIHTFALRVFRAER